MTNRIALAALVLCATACRGERGQPDYTSHIGLRTDAGVVESLPGPVPFERGDDRLSFGIFYEGESSDLIGIDDVDRFYNVFIGSFEQDPALERVEGQQSDRILLNGTPFWGGGIDWTTPQDLSSWTHMCVSFRSSDASFPNVDIGMASGGQQGVVQAADYGYVNDGEWHSLLIPLEDFGISDLTSVTVPFSLGGPGGERNDILLVDDLYLIQE